MFTILAALLTATANMLTAALVLFCILLLMRFVMNFYAEGTSNPGVVFVFRFTELILDPIRRKMGVEPRVVDLALLVVFFGSIFFGTLVIDILRKLSTGLAS